MLSQPRTFRCPNCKEMINDSMKNCRFCQVAIDPAIAELIAGRQELVNRACTDASYLRSAAVAMYVFILVSLILGIAFWAFVVTFFVVIVLLIRWQARYNNIITDDPDYARARKSRTVAFFLAVVAMPLALALQIGLELLINGIPATE